MIEIKGRPAKLSNHVNVRAQGGDNVTAIDLPVTFPLSEEEFDALIGEGAHERFYVNPGNRPVEPRYKGLNFSVEHKIEDATVVFSIGVAPDRYTLTGVKLSKIDLKLCVGGMTECTLTIQAVPGDEAMGRISSKLNQEVEIDISDGKRVDPKKSRAEKKKTEADPAEPQLPLEATEAPDTAARDQAQIDQAARGLEGGQYGRLQYLQHEMTTRDLTKGETAELKMLMKQRPADSPALNS